MLDLRLLGPPELIIGGHPVDLGGPRQRIVLSLLALNANRVTPVDELLDAVWGDSPPSTARGQVQICISALRKLLADSGPGTIRTQPPGYVLTAGPEELDVHVFLARVQAGRNHAAADRPVEAATELRAALALWRGPALAGVGGDAVHREATRLEERRTSVLEQLVRLDLSLGRHQELIGELRAQVAQQPLQERLHAFLMLALYRSGRQAEALEAGRRARQILSDEVGVDPGQELQEMERAILARDPRLDPPRPATTATAPASRAAVGPEPRPGPPAAPPAVPRQLPPSIGDFTGRDGELAEIRGALAGGHGTFAMPIVAISGQGGVGKSCLVVRAAHELADEYPDGQLYADLSAGEVDGGAHRQLARFLRALGVGGPEVPEDVQERAELYRSRLANRRVLVVLDAASDEDQVRPLLPGNPQCAVVTTSRGRLTGLSGAHHVTIEVLDAEHSVAMIGSIIGAERISAEPAAGTELVGLCDGLPLALRIAGARLASRPHWRVRDLVRRLADQTRRLDELAHKGLELRSNIALTYWSLAEPARRLFRMATLVQANDFPGWAAAALLDTGLLAAEELLESLVDVQVLDVLALPEDGTRRYRFHDLVRIYALERLAEEETEADRRAALARYLGGWLSLSDAAHRREYGGDYTVLHGSAPRWVPPDDELPDHIADPLTWWERERRGLVPAIRQAAAEGFDEACWDLALTSVTLFESRAWFDDWVETAQWAAEVTARTGNRRGQAAALYSLGTRTMAHKRLDEAEEHFAAALALFTEAGDPHGRGLVLRNAAFISRVRGDHETMSARYAEALAELHRAGDRVGAAHILSSLAKVRIDERDITGARALLDEAAAICREANCLRVEAQVTYRLAELHLGEDDIELARQALHRTLRVVRDLGDKIGEAYVLHALGVVRHREGRLDSAHTTLTHALALARQVNDSWVEGQALFGLGEVTLARGNEAAGAEHLRQAAAIFRWLDATLWEAKSLLQLAEVAPREVDLDRALALLGTLNSAEARQLAALAERARAAQARAAQARAAQGAGVLRDPS